MGQKGSNTIQRGLRLPLWMNDALDEIAEKTGYTFTDVVTELLRKELEFEGYTMGIGRDTAESKKPIGATGTDG